MKKYSLSFLMICWAGISIARVHTGNCAYLNQGLIEKNIDSSKALKIGDKVPDLVINNIINYPKSSVKISDFKGKLLILDFWATWCSPCVGMIPKMDALQNQFDGRIQFLPVSYQSKEVVLPFLERLGKQKHSRLPDVVGDSVLVKLFPHTYLPHYVWIDGTGTVRAITEYADVNAANITAMLSGSVPKLETKVDDVKIPYDPEKPLFMNNNGGNGSALTYHSLFSGYVSGLNCAYNIFKADTTKGIRIVATNAIITMLYQVAYGDDVYFGNNRTVFETKDIGELTTNLKGAASLQWMSRNHAFCYELQVPPNLNSKAFYFMQQDMERLFPQYHAHVEKRKMPCLVLVRTSQTDHLKSHGGETDYHFDGTQGLLHNASLKILAGELNVVYLAYLPTPIIDETGYAGNVDLEIQANLSNVDEINDALAAYDLKLVPGERAIDVLVIGDHVQ